MGSIKAETARNTESRIPQGRLRKRYAGCQLLGKGGRHRPVLVSRAESVLRTVGIATAMRQSVELLRRDSSIVLAVIAVNGVKIALGTAKFPALAQRILAIKMGSTQPRFNISKVIALYGVG